MKQSAAILALSLCLAACGVVVQAADFLDYVASIDRQHTDKPEWSYGTPDDWCAPLVTVYGFAQADYIQDFNRVQREWEDTLRPSRIPTVDGLYGADGVAVVGVRQSRLGVDGNIPTHGGTVKTKFEFDMFGVGADEGQTTIRLRHAWGEFGSWRAGQAHSLFMDIDVFPNVIDYWGPAGMVFLRTPQIRWQPVRGTHYLALAIENPDPGIDVGVFSRVIQDLDVDVEPVGRLPDFTARYRFQNDRGHFQAAGILRTEGYETLETPLNEPKESFVGWGINLSGNLKIGERDRLITAFVIGEGIASYMNDGGVDLAPRQRTSPANVATQPLQGIVLYYDHYWTSRLSSSIGYSATSVENYAGQRDDAFRRGEYASVNLLLRPRDNVMCGIEYLWGQRTDWNRASGQDNRIQTSFKYSW